MYTKGKWYLEEESGLILSIQGGEDSPIVVANIGGSDTAPKTIGELSANAQLIVAAPLGYELAEVIIKLSATWLSEGLLEIGEGDYLHIKQLALELKAKADGGK